MSTFDMILKDLNSHIQYRKSDNIVQDLKEIIDSAQSYAYSSVNIALVFRNWLIGKRIAEEEMQGETRAEYGAELLKTLAKEMEKSYGKGLNQRNLYYYVRFYDYFPQILNAVSSKSMLSLTSKYQQDKLEFIKNPVIAEFLGISKDTSYLESDLEQFIIDNLQKFIMELGKGYALSEGSNILKQRKKITLLTWSFTIIF